MLALFFLDVVRKPFMHFGFLDLNLRHGPLLQEGGRPEVTVHPHVPGGVASSSQEAPESTGRGLLLRVPSGTRPPKQSPRPPYCGFSRWGGAVPHAGAEPPLKSVLQEGGAQGMLRLPRPWCLRAARRHLGQETLAAQQVPPGATLSLPALGTVFLCFLL